MLTLWVVLAFSYSVAFADARTIGPFSSELGPLRFELTDETASSAGFLRIEVETDVRKDIWSDIYSANTDDVSYLLPLTPDASSFLIVENLGSGYRTVILRVESLQSVVTQLDVSGKDFPEVIRTGAEDTRFVIVINASKVGDVLDVVDIYALQGGLYKFEGRVPYGQKLMAVEQLSRKIDQAAADRRKEVVVHP